MKLRKKYSYIRRHWLIILTGILIIGKVGYGLLFLIFSGLPIYTESLIIQHSGWYLSHGGRIYIDFYSIKPPAVTELVSIISILLGRDVWNLHIGSIITTNALVILSGSLIGMISYRLTDNEIAGIVGGLAMFAQHNLFVSGWGGAGGLAHIGAIFVGFLGVYLALKRKWFLAGVFVAMAPAFYQLGLIFPVIVLGLSLHKSKRIDIMMSLGGMVTGSVVILAPIVYWGAFDNMISAVILSAATSSDTQSLLTYPIGYAIYRSAAWMRSGAFLILFAGIGLLRIAYTDLKVVGIPHYWWIIVGGSWSFLSILFLDFDGPPDLYMGMAFVGLSIAIIYKNINNEYKTQLIFAVLLIMLINYSSFIALDFGVDRPRVTLEESREIAKAESKITQETHESDMMDIIYWNQIRVEYCYPQRFCFQPANQI